MIVSVYEVNRSGQEGRRVALEGKLLNMLPGCGIYASVNSHVSLQNHPHSRAGDNRFVDGRTSRLTSVLSFSEFFAGEY